MIDQSELVLAIAMPIIVVLVIAICNGKRY